MKSVLLLNSHEYGYFPAPIAISTTMNEDYQAVKTILEKRK